MPRSKLVRIGVWENDKFIGAVIYGVGAGNSTNGVRFGLAKSADLAELCRVALCPHENPTSKIVAISIKMLRRAFEGLKLLVSFADSAQGHIGIIYQASGWFFLSAKEENNGAYCVKGKIVHPRTLYDRYGKGGQSIPWLHRNVDANAARIKTPIKFHYVYPLNKKVETLISSMALPYPKRPASIESDAFADQAEQGGASPTAGLQPVQVAL